MARLATDKRIVARRASHDASRGAAADNEICNQLIDVMKLDGAQTPPPVAAAHNAPPGAASVLSSVPATSLPPASRDICEAMCSAFLDFQKEREEWYAQAIMSRILKMQVQAEKKAKCKLPTVRPQEGGTTATMVTAFAHMLHVAWVGDSRAVLCRAAPLTRTAAPSPLLAAAKASVQAIPLTTDHNVSAGRDGGANAADLNRAVNAGGCQVGQYIASPNAEGMVQLTRSLGDAAFHIGGVVSASPDISVVSCHGSAAECFLIVASDGVWHALSNEDAASFVYSALAESGYAAPRGAPDKDSTSDADEERNEQLLMSACSGLCEEAKRRTIEMGVKPDDISAVILTFARYWSVAPPPQNEGDAGAVAQYPEPDGTA